MSLKRITFLPRNKALVDLNQKSFLVNEENNIVAVAKAKAKFMQINCRYLGYDKVEITEPEVL